MLRIKIRDPRKGLHPREFVAIVDTISGPQELVIDEQAKTRGYLEVGYEIATRGSARLIELPTETSNGAWRVWVDNTSIMDATMEAAE